MNSLKKVYCRGFQKVFRIAIPFLPYRKPKIAGSVKELPISYENISVPMSLSLQTRESPNLD